MKNALSDDPRRNHQQEEALKNLENAFEECEAAGLVFIRQGATPFVFDEDKLFAAGWNTELPIIRFLSELGMREVKVYDTVIPNRFADQENDD